MSGTLFVVSLPIGHLDDITLRAIETLCAVDGILAEDTRTTRIVLARHGIETPFYSSLYEGVEHQRTESIVDRLRSGSRLALVSDAGTPLISDPGYPLVRACVDAGILVVPIPGPSAVIAALVASGLPPNRFCFEGMAPRTDGARRALFERLVREERTIVLYESSHRICSTLSMIDAILPGRPVVVARELTKVHEEFLRGSAGAIAEELESRNRVRGEAVILIGGSAPPGAVGEDVAGRLAVVLRREGLSRRSIARTLYEGLGVPRNQAYRISAMDSSEAGRSPADPAP